MEYSAKTFDIPALEGISQKSIDEHIGLYQGYVKNLNAITKAAADLMAGDNMHAISELWRRRSFEFDGMRLHELYFEQLEGGAKPFDLSSDLASQAAKELISGNGVQPELLMKRIASMRGPGWAILYWDPVGKCLQSAFVGEQHQGHFATLPVILAVDVWEHAYLLDYGAQGKSAYVDAFFKNLNWKTVEKRFASLRG